MTTKKYLQRMKQHEATFNRLWEKVVKDTNEFLETNQERGWEVDNKVEGMCDSLCLSGAWVKDRLDGKSGLPSNDTYKRSLTKRIRKALGYTL